MNASLPPRQKAVLDAVRHAIRAYRRPPTVNELARELGVSGPTVHQHLRALERKGLLRRLRGSPRGIELVGQASIEPEGECTRVPVVGEIAGGPLNLAVEHPHGYVWVNRRVAPGDVVFALRVRGNSMTDAGILDGDLIVVRQQQTARDGDIVVALVGDEATVKRFHRMGRKVLLRPENPSMEPIEVPAEEVQIQGKVIAVERFIEGE